MIDTIQTCKQCEGPITLPSSGVALANAIAASERRGFWLCKPCRLNHNAKASRTKNADAIRARQKEKFANDAIAREKKNAMTRAWRERMGSEAVREGDQRSRYGVTRKEIGSACAICGNTNNLCVDHDHACCPGDRCCGKCVRDVLCVSCNTLIGKLESNRGRFEVIKGYLKLWNATF